MTNRSSLLRTAYRPLGSCDKEYFMRPTDAPSDYSLNTQKIRLACFINHSEPRQSLAHSRAHEPVREQAHEGVLRHERWPYAVNLSRGSMMYIQLESIRPPSQRVRLSSRWWYAPLLLSVVNIHPGYRFSTLRAFTVKVYKVCISRGAQTLFLLFIL